jgi:putative Ca2+/H+ antiporter (TMEM165/GDT1 family)
MRSYWKAVTAFFKAFGLIALAELGDKSQLLALSFATRYRPLVVLTGIAIVAFGLNLAWALAGGLLGDALPERPIMIAAGVLFILFGVLALRDGGEEEEKAAGSRFARHALLAVTAAFFLSELGDKTMLASATLATTQGWLPTWLGAALGMTAADGLAIAAGVYAKARLPGRPVRLLSAALFITFGVWSIVFAISG